MTATRSLSSSVQRLGLHLLAQDADGLSDAELVRRFVERHDEAAFAALVHRFGSLVLGVCRRVLRHQQDAEDAFQAAFLVLARNASKVQRAEAIGNWLYGVAYNVARKAKAMRHKRVMKESEAVAARPESQPDPANDLRESLDAELQALPDKYRLAIILCDLRGLTRQEAAGEAGCLPKTLGTRLDRGRALLARRLTRRGFAISAATLAALWSTEASASVPQSLVVSTVSCAAGTATVPPLVALLTQGASKTMLSKSLLYIAAISGLAVVAGLSHGPSFFAAHAATAERRSAPETTRVTRDTRVADPLEAIHTLLRALHSHFTAAEDKKDDKPAPVAKWEKKESELRILFAGKDELKISPHGKDDINLILCTYTIDKDGLVKGKVTGFEGGPDFQENLKEKLPVGTEFSFRWKVKGDAGTLSDVKGEKAEMLKSHLEGDFAKKK